MDNWFFHPRSSPYRLGLYAVSAERAACTLWKEDCFRICTTAVRLSILLVPVNFVDSDRSTGWTHRGHFPGDNAVGPLNWQLSHSVQKNRATPPTPICFHGKNKDSFTLLVTYLAYAVPPNRNVNDFVPEYEASRPISRLLQSPRRNPDYRIMPRLFVWL